MTDDYPYEKSQPVVYSDPRLIDPDGDRRWMLEEEMIPTDKAGMPIPMLRTKQVAGIFFGRKPSWMYFLFNPRTFRGYDGEGKEIRQNVGHSYFLLDGQPMTFREDRHGRYYSLADVERIVHALIQQGRIDGATANRALLIVKTSAQQAGILP